MTVTDEKCRIKGRFIRSKELLRREKAREICASRRKVARTKNSDENRKLKQVDDFDFELPLWQLLVGSRVVELSVFAQNMHCRSCTSVLSIQNTIAEIKKGLHSTLVIKCSSCGTLTNVPLSGFHKVKNSETSTEKQTLHSNITTNAVLGTVHAGIGYSELMKILACMDIPSFSSKTYKHYEREVGRAIEKAAKRSCKGAALEERRLVIEQMEKLRAHIPRQYQDEYFNEMKNAIAAHEKENQADFDISLGAIVNIIVSYDMGWSKRGNGRAYDSLNGYGAMIGFLSKKVLDYKTCNRKCRACDKGIPKDKHDCRLNFHGSAKAMEASAGSDMILHSSILKEAGLNVKIVVGDEDSSLMAAINRQNTGHKIHKLADKNHCTKNVSSKLYPLQKIHSELNKKGLISHVKRCFAYALSQNKGDSVTLATQIRCIPQHLSNNHDGCGNWCRRKSTNGKGIFEQKFIIKSPELIQALEDFFAEYADNAEKYCVTASSQANEAFNHTVTSKFPKYKSYSTTESGDFRVASAVCQKNLGESYLIDVKNHDLGMKVTPILTKHCNAIDTVHSKRAENANTRQEKIKRIRNKQNRDNLRNKLETKEGITYQSNMGFKLDMPKKKSSQIEVDGVFEGTFTLVFFDLETSGRSNNADILQLAAVSQEKAFSVYMQPTQQIDKAAPAINGLSFINGDLYLKNKKLDTVSIMDGLIQFSVFLKQLDGQSLLIAHNASFDMRFLLRDIAKYSLMEQFDSIIYGFSDSLKLFRAQFPERKLEKGKGLFKLETLATDLLKNQSGFNFHDAKYDVMILQKLVIHNIPTYSLLQSAVKFDMAMSNFVKNSIITSRQHDLASLRSILSTHMIKKLATLEISYNKLKEIYDNGGSPSLIKFLSEKVEKKIRFTKDPVILQKMVDHFDNICA